MKDILHKTAKLILLSSFLSFIACTNEDNQSSSKDDDIKKMISVRILVEGIEVNGSVEDELSRSANEEAPVTFICPLGDGFSFEGTLEAEKKEGAASRGALTSLSAGTTYRVVAYKMDGTSSAFEKQEDFKIGESAVLMLPEGKYRLYAYSYNNSSPLPSMSQQNVIDINGGYTENENSELNILYKDAGELDLSNGDVSFSFNFQKLCSKLTLKLDAGEAALEITKASATIDACLKGTAYNYILNQWTTETPASPSYNFSSFVVPNFAVTGMRYLLPATKSLKINISLDVAGLGNRTPNVEVKNYQFKPNINYVMTGKIVPPPTYYDEITINGVTWCAANSTTKNGKLAKYPWTYTNNLEVNQPAMSGYYWYWGQIVLSNWGAAPSDNWVEINPNAPSEKLCPSGYRLPTKEDFERLLSPTVHKWWGEYTYAGSEGKKVVKGYFFGMTSTAPTVDTRQNYLFLPACGYGDGTTLRAKNEGEIGYYCSSTTDMSVPEITNPEAPWTTYHNSAYYLYFSKTSSPQVITQQKDYGIQAPIRCVKM